MLHQIKLEGALEDALRTNSNDSWDQALALVKQSDAASQAHLRAIGWELPANLTLLTREQLIVCGNGHKVRYFATIATNNFAQSVRNGSNIEVQNLAPGLLRSLIENGAWENMTNDSGENLVHLLAQRNGDPAWHPDLDAVIRHLAEKHIDNDAVIAGLNDEQAFSCCLHKPEGQQSADGLVESRRKSNDIGDFR